MSRFIGFHATAGGIEAEFGDVEREVLDWLGVELTALLRTGDATPDDARVLDRLLPAAYPEDAGAAEEFAGYTRERIADGKRERMEAILSDLGPLGEGSARRVRLTPERAAIWAQGLTDLRLVFAERTGIAAGRRAPRSAADVYDWLGALQWSLVEALDDVQQP